MHMKSVQVISLYQIDFRIQFNIYINQDILFHKLPNQTPALFIQNHVKEQYTTLMSSPLTGLTSPLSKKSIKRLKNDLSFSIIQTKTSRFTQHLNCLRFLHLLVA